MQIQKTLFFLVIMSFTIFSKLVAEESLEAVVNRTAEEETSLEKKAEPKKQKGYHGSKIEHENMAFFDNVISLVPQTYQELTVILKAAEDVLRQGQQKTLIDIDASRDSLVKTFEKFAMDIQSRAEYILPVLDESLDAAKLAKLGITLIDGKSILRTYAVSKDKPAEFFKEHIKTSEQLLQFSVEMFVYLNDFKFNLRKTRGAYKRDLERKKHVKEEDEANKKRRERGEKEELDPV